MEGAGQGGGGGVPFFEECLDAGDGVELSIGSDSRQVLDDAMEDGERVSDAFRWDEGWLTEVRAVELNSIGKQGGLSGLVHYMKEAVVAEVRADVETIAIAEIP